MTVGVDVSPRVQQLSEGVVANVLLQRFLRADDERPASAARIGRKRERLDIIVVNEIERAFGRRADKRRTLYNARLECSFYIYAP